MSVKGLPVYIISGFLGSGKTTFMNNLLEYYSDKKIGLLVNDFGPVGIDKSLLKQELASGDIIELNQGQIFCSCLSSSFLDSLMSFREKDVEFILVEASGLSKPSIINELLKELEGRSGQYFNFGGMICLIDADRYRILSQAVNAVNEQLQFSDYVVINKTDLASEAERLILKEEINQLHSEVTVYETSFGKFDFDLLADITVVEKTKSPRDFRGWGDKGRPDGISIRWKDAFKRSDLDALLNHLHDHCLRIKGYVPAPDSGVFRINRIGQVAACDLLETSPLEDPALVILYFKEEEVEELLSVWSQKHNLPVYTISKS